MNRSKAVWPVALTIAGSDSGGGAGIQADLKTFFALKTHGTSAITCLTAQNPKKVAGIEVVSPKFLRLQLEALFDQLPPHAVKTGMLFSRNLIDVLREFFTELGVPLIVDPVMVATSGSVLLRPNAIAGMKLLCKQASLITPNLAEAEILSGQKIRTEEGLRKAARALHEEFGSAVLLKGGHLTSSREAADIFYDGQRELLLTAQRIKGVSTHGTGCTYSAAITSFLAHGFKLEQSVIRAKQVITDAIASSVRAGKFDVLNP